MFLSVTLTLYSIPISLLPPTCPTILFLSAYYHQLVLPFYSYQTIQFTRPTILPVHLFVPPNFHVLFPLQYSHHPIPTKMFPYSSRVAHFVILQQLSKLTDDFLQRQVVPLSAGGKPMSVFRIL